MAEIERAEGRRIIETINLFGHAMLCTDKKDTLRFLADAQMLDDDVSVLTE